MVDLIKSKETISPRRDGELRNCPVRSSPITLIYGLIGAAIYCSACGREQDIVFAFRISFDYTVVNYTVLSQDVTIARNRIHAVADRIELMRLECSRSNDANFEHIERLHIHDDAVQYYLYGSDRRLSGSFVSVPSLEFIRCDLLRWTARAAEWPNVSIEWANVVMRSRLKLNFRFFFVSWNDQTREKNKWFLRKSGRKIKWTKARAHKHQLEMVKKQTECKVWAEHSPDDTLAASFSVEIVRVIYAARSSHDSWDEFKWNECLINLKLEIKKKKKNE